MTALRLIQPDGQPTLSRAEAKLIAETRSLLPELKTIVRMIEIALDEESAISVALGTRTVMSIGLHLNDYARAAGQ